MADKNFGFIPSTMDGTEIIFGAPEKLNIPSTYNYRPYLPRVINQGELSICVPCSISANLNWRENLKDGEPKDNKIALMDIYAAKTTEGDGMTFKEALHFLRHEGVRSKVGLLKIGHYGRVVSIPILKYALVMNGPCLGALPVYSDDCDFWNKKYGQSLLGYHAISIVGYDEDGFIIRNSWGDDFCDGGYTKIDAEDFTKLIEVWTIID